MPKCTCCGKKRTMLKVKHPGYRWDARLQVQMTASERICRVCQRWARKLGVQHG